MCIGIVLHQWEGIKAKKRESGIFESETKKGYQFGAKSMIFNSGFVINLVRALLTIEKRATKLF